MKSVWTVRISRASLARLLALAILEIALVIVRTRPLVFAAVKLARVCEHAQIACVWVLLRRCEVGAPMASEDTGSADGSLTIGDIVQGQNVVNAHLLRLHVEQCEYVDGDDEGMARRDIFACLTCFKKTGKHAGICRPCSIRCHADHDLVELGRKYVKCDCGNQGRLGGVECQMVAGVRHDNPHNRYNHNFEGRFCSCDRPYAASETMYQVRRTTPHGRSPRPTPCTLNCDRRVVPDHAVLWV